MVKIMTTGPVVLARSGGKGKRSRGPEPMCEVITPISRRRTGLASVIWRHYMR